MNPSVLEAWGLQGASLSALGSGLINHTWKAEAGDADFVLQRINDSVFKQPGNIAHNLRVIGDFLQQHAPDYFFVAPIPTVKGEDLLHLLNDGFYRIFSFVKGSHTIDVVQSPDQAFEAARQFGRFTHQLRGLPLDQLRITIPHFHDLAFRYEQFSLAVSAGNPARIKEAKPEILALAGRSGIVQQFTELSAGGEFLQRVMHHDTKISNVLFDANDKGMAVIDLDTVMPGYFVSDVGDMLRTYLSPVSEEEIELGKIEVRPDYFFAIRDGYLEAMAGGLTPPEKSNIVFAGRYMIYMQALRFLTDFLTDDRYYGEKYPGHNLMRARNQLTLLEQLEANKKLQK